MKECSCSRPVGGGMMFLTGIVVPFCQTHLHYSFGLSWPFIVKWDCANHGSGFPQRKLSRLTFTIAPVPFYDRLTHINCKQLTSASETLCHPTEA